MRAACLLTIVGCLVHLEPTYGKLKLVQAIFRHGNRNPTESKNFYPNDPYVNLTYQPEGTGGLTNVGKMSVYKLGEFFRKRYGEFLGPTYSPQVIRFRADEVDRIIMTAQLVAAALFPPTNRQKWHPEIYWQPIPVWTRPTSEDYLYNGVFCSNHRKYRADVEKNDSFLQSRQRKYQPLFDYMSEQTGSNVTQFVSFFLRQLLYAQMDVGLKLEEWTKPIFPNKVLDKIAVLDLYIQSYTLKMKQMTAGVWIGEWLNNVKQHLNDSLGKKPKAYMYAAHELNIAPILIAFDNFDDEVPSYSSSVVFELHEIDDNLYVQMVYKNRNNVRILELPKCHCKMCPLETFKEIVAPLVPENPKKLCGDILLT